MKDDNERILELIQERLAIGEERYGHGVRNMMIQRNGGLRLILGPKWD